MYNTGMATQPSCDHCRSRRRHPAGVSQRAPVVLAVSATATLNSLGATSKGLAELAGDMKSWGAECVPGSQLGGLTCRGLCQQPRPLVLLAAEWARRILEQQ